MLYLPRGTVHHAEAQSKACSHVTLSTYQRWTYGADSEVLSRRLMILHPEDGIITSNRRLALMMFYDVRTHCASMSNA